MFNKQQLRHSKVAGSMYHHTGLEQSWDFGKLVFALQQCQVLVCQSRDYHPLAHLYKVLIVISSPVKKNLHFDLFGCLSKFFKSSDLVLVQCDQAASFWKCYSKTNWHQINISEGRKINTPHPLASTPPQADYTLILMIKK